MLTNHIRHLHDKFPGARIVIFLESNLDQFHTGTLRTQLLIDKSIRDYIYIVSANKKDENKVGVFIDKDNKEMAAEFIKNMFLFDKARIYHRFFSFPQTDDEKKLNVDPLENFIQKLSNMEWCPVKKYNPDNPGTEDMQYTISGKHHGPDDVGIAAMMVAFWASVFLSDPNTRIKFQHLREFVPLMSSFYSDMHTSTPPPIKFYTKESILGRQ